MQHKYIISPALIFASLTNVAVPANIEVQVAFPLPAAPLISDFVLDHHGMVNMIPKIQDHGCWCAKLDGNPEHRYLGGTDTIDDLDALCRRWFIARHCLLLPGGTCEYSDGQEKYSANDNTSQVTCNANSAHTGDAHSICAYDSCLIDLKFLYEIKNFLDSNPSWQKNKVGDNECSIPHTPHSIRYCRGDSPDVYVIGGYLTTSASFSTTSTAATTTEATTAGATTAGTTSARPSTAGATTAGATTAASTTVQATTIQATTILATTTEATTTEATTTEATTTEATTTASTSSEPATTTPVVTTTTLPSLATCFGKSADLTFLIDASLQVSDENYAREVGIIQDLVSSFSIDPANTAATIIAFGNNNEKRAVTATDSTALQSAVDGLANRSTLSSEGTYTGKNLGQTYLHINQNQRAGVPQILIVLTDGQSIDNLSLNGWDMTTYDELLNLSVTTYAVGIGSLADEDELKRMASDPESETVLNTDNFINKGLENSLILSVCNNL